jgi:hypothetical protein
MPRRPDNARQAQASEFLTDLQLPEQVKGDQGMPFFATFRVFLRISRRQRPDAQVAGFVWGEIALSVQWVVGARRLKSRLV